MMRQRHNTITRWSVIILALAALTVGAPNATAQEGKADSASAEAKNSASAAAKNSESTTKASAKLSDTSDKAPTKEALAPEVHRDLAPPATEKAAATDVTPAPATDLMLRPSKPLTLSEEPETSGWWWKLIVCGIIIFAAVWLFRRRTMLQQVKQSHSLRILSRTAVGVRSELLIVDVDGQKLVLGVTPHSIQRVAVLPDGSETQLADPALEQTVDPVAQAIDADPGFDHAVMAAQQRLDRYAHERELLRARNQEEPARRPDVELLDTSATRAVSPTDNREPRRARRSNESRNETPARRSPPPRARQQRDSQAHGLMDIGRKLRKVR